MHLVLGTPQGSSNKQSHLAPFCKAPDTTPNPMLIPLGGAFVSSLPTSTWCTCAFCRPRRRQDGAASGKQWHPYLLYSTIICILSLPEHTRPLVGLRCPSMSSTISLAGRDAWTRDDSDPSQNYHAAGVPCSTSPYYSVRRERRPPRIEPLTKPCFTVECRVQAL